MLIKPSAPWVYLFWRQPKLSAESEMALARLMRREGSIYMLRMYWRIVTNEREDRRTIFSLGCAWIFLAKNYPPFLCLAGYLIGLEDCGVIAAVWGLSFAYGSVRELAWLFSLLYRWPPIAKG